MPQIPGFLKGNVEPLPLPRRDPPLPKRDIEDVISDAIQHTLSEAAKVILASAQQLLNEATEAQHEAQVLADSLAEMGTLQSQKIRQLTSKVAAIKTAISNSANTVGEYLPSREIDVPPGLEADIITSEAPLIVDPKESDR